MGKVANTIKITNSNPSVKNLLYVNLEISMFLFPKNTFRSHQKQEYEDKIISS